MSSTSIAASHSASTSLPSILPTHTHLFPTCQPHQNSPFIPYYHHFFTHFSPPPFHPFFTITHPLLTRSSLSPSLFTRSFLSPPPSHPFFPITPLPFSPVPHSPPLTRSSLSPPPLTRSSLSPPPLLTRSSLSPPPHPLTHSSSVLPGWMHSIHCPRTRDPQ